MKEPNHGDVIVTAHGIFRVPHFDYEKHGYPPYSEPTPVERSLFERIERLEDFVKATLKTYHPLNELRQRFEGDF